MPIIDTGVRVTFRDAEVTQAHVYVVQALDS